ncbi:putative trigger factor protein [Toxoplasma gondii MAS]|uniref:peptidylprolyl isomerase n=1 Tax=Toxoplasma gondii MAS TaxID=943118 RepID=A0A086QE58_TOXGO|nr:putative trigger factor protein [Toxoplasma gondii MAS]
MGKLAIRGYPAPLHVLKRNCAFVFVSFSLFASLPLECSVLHGPSQPFSSPSLQPRTSVSPSRRKCALSSNESPLSDPPNNVFHFGLGSELSAHSSSSPSPQLPQNPSENIAEETRGARRPDLQSTHLNRLLASLRLTLFPATTAVPPHPCASISRSSLSASPLCLSSSSPLCLPSPSPPSLRSLPAVRARLSYVLRSRLSRQQIRKSIAFLSALSLSFSWRMSSSGSPCISLPLSSGRSRPISAARSSLRLPWSSALSHTPLVWLSRRPSRAETDLESVGSTGKAGESQERDSFNGEEGEEDEIDFYEDEETRGCATQQLFFESDPEGDESRDARKNDTENEEEGDGGEAVAEGSHASDEWGGVGEKQGGRSNGGKDNRDCASSQGLRSFKERRKQVQQRRTAYLRRGKRFGAASPEIVGKDSERVDMALIEDLASHLPVAIHRSGNATVLIEADIPAHITQRVQDLTIAHLRTTLRVPGYRSGLGEVPLSMLQYYAGGVDAVKQRAVQALGDLLLHQATNKGAKIIGTPQFVQATDELTKKFHPGQSMKIQIRCDTLPTVKFKENYRGLKLRVPRPPYPKGLLFQKAEEILAKRHAHEVDFPDDARRARMGDAAEIEVTRGWFETGEEARGDEIPTHLIAGKVTVILDKDCNPEGGAELVDGLLGIRKGDAREVRVPLPFSVKEMLPFSGVDQIGNLPAGASTQTPSPRVSATGFLEGEQVPSEGSGGLGETERADGSGLSMVQALAREAGEKCGIGFTDERKEHILDEDEERLVQTILHVKCLGVKRRIPRELNDEFYRKVLNETRTDFMERLEATGDELVEAASVKARRGAVAAALDDITTIEAPETLIEEQARLTYKQQLKSKEMEGQDVTGLDTEEKYQEWKSKNVNVVVKLLKTAFTIKAIMKNENLKVDQAKLMKSVEETLMKCPGQKPDLVTERTLNLMESQLVYDFVADHGDITYYVEERPVTASVVHKSSDGDKSYGMKAYPAGADVERYKKNREALVEENEKLKDLASKFFVEPGGKKRPPPLKPEDE